MGAGKLRVLAVSPSSVRGGAGTVLRRALSEASAQGWEVSCICPEGELAVDLSSEGHVVRPGPEIVLPAGPRLWAVGRLVGRAARLAAMLRGAAELDVIVANNIMVLPSLAVARPKAPVVLLVQDVIVRPDRLRLLRACRSVVRSAVAVSEAAAQAPRAAGIATEVVANGTPWPVDAAPEMPLHPPVVGCVAALTPWKGQDVLLDAIPRLQRADVVVELVGEAMAKDGAYEQLLRDKVAALGLVDRVRFCGHLRTPLDRVRGWTVSVSASVEPEAFGLSTIEAMSVGVPVVGADHGATSSIVGDAGLLYTPGDPASLAEALDRLIGDPALRRRCREAGRDLVGRHFQVDRQTEALVAAIARPAQVPA